MNPALVGAAGVAGGFAGWLSGWLAVTLEKAEGLEQEEAEEREQYRRETAAEELEPWAGDSYGWTWMERWLSPLLGAAGFALFAAHEGPGAGLGIHLLWVAVFVHIVAFDLKHRLILNRITYPALAAALALAPLTPGLTLGESVTGAVLVAAFFLTQSLLSGGRIGLGDAKLGALVGAVTGLGIGGGQLRALYAVTAAVLLGGGVAMLLLITRVRGLKDPIPYGPFLCAGAALMLYQTPS